MNINYKFNLKKNKKIFYLAFLLIFSFSFNQYYGYIGILPLDSFLIFNSGYDFLNGYFPFKDYWTITGPLLDLIQAFFFKIFGVSWFSYVIHASTFNFLMAFCTFYTLYNFKLDINYCLFYSLLVSVICYPIAGTPFMDHHSTILSIIGLFSFILALKTEQKFYWFFMPIIFGLAFLCKQTPAAYLIIVVSILSIIHFYFFRDLKKIILLFSGSLTFVFFFVIILLIGDISLISFFEQYILFPRTMGESRLELLFPLEFKRIILRFKLIHLSLFFLIYLVIKKIIEDQKYIKGQEFLIIISLIVSSFALITHQLMTINAKYIFFIIPIMCGFTHIYYKKYFDKKKYFLFFVIFLSLSSTIYYQNTYNQNRRFMDLQNINIKNAVNAISIDQKLNNLKWISILYPENPNEEITKLNEAIKIIKKDNKKKTIVTDYQFISVILNIYDYSPNRFWHKGVGYPNKGEKYFNTYRSFFINKLKENKIEIIYSVKPLYFEKEFLEPIISSECFKKTVLTDILDSYLLLNCKDLAN
tara:strand:- start:1545 stop:3131 length:1587 start_codon:yes stop_codon:yes gene_type:complete